MKMKKSCRNCIWWDTCERYRSLWRRVCPDYELRALKRIWITALYALVLGIGLGLLAAKGFGQ